MYSLVVAATMITASATPAWGCGGCNGGCYGCWGGCFGGCWGASCYGCFGCHGGSGCHGGCWGHSCHGAYGCYGGWNCHGCWSSCMGCYGSSGWGCSGGCWSNSCWGYSAGSYSGCWGCSGGSAYSGLSNVVVQPAPVAVVSESTNQSPAQLKVDVPAAARLYVNDVLVHHPTPHASFTTPALEPGKTYHYVLRAEVTRGGKTTTVVRQVNVEAGKRSEVRFEHLDAVNTAKR